MPLLEEEAIAGSWSRLPERAIKNLGVVPVNEIKFDETRKKSISDDVFIKLEWVA
jgi:hypothetical protein